MEFKTIESIKSLAVYVSTGWCSSDSKIISIWRKPFKLEILASDYQLTLTEFPELENDLTLSKDWALRIAKPMEIHTSANTTYILSFLGYDLLAFSFNDYRNDDIEIQTLGAIKEKSVVF